MSTRAASTGRSAHDYVLRVRAGATYEQLRTVRVNDEAAPLLVDGAHFTGFVAVRYLNFAGVTPAMDAALAGAAHAGAAASPPPSPAPSAALPTPAAQAPAAAAQPPAALDADAAAPPSPSRSSCASSLSGAPRSHAAATPDAAPTAAAAAASPAAAASDDARPIRNPASDYFRGRNRRYSIMLQGRFRRRWAGDDLIFGVDMATPMRTPPATSVAIRIAKWLDPAIEADLDCPTPYIYSPIVSSMNSLAVYRPADMPAVADGSITDSPAIAPPPAPVSVASAARSLGSLLLGRSSSKSLPAVQPAADADNAASQPDAPRNAGPGMPSIDIGPWAFASRRVPESTALLFPDPAKRPVLPTYEKRKRHFADLAKRNAVVFSPDNVYCMDFYDAYFDFNTVSVRLPGFSLNAFRYWDGQPLRYVAMSRDRSAIFFVVTFELVERSKYGDLAELDAVAETAADLEPEPEPPAPLPIEIDGVPETPAVYE
ncbi:hypothetical protein HK105_200627 [Polyrhizophydium stewartii]|uniref:Domain of unknown function at the cortex 1 domain-containing protein n=1 Tax=Polyrhizophydium stewartii TaxID=2732419 RepID=A0ABR4NJN2_9FUNG